MVPSKPDQLELFDVAHQPGPRPHHDLVGRLVFQLRQDQLVLVGIAGLLGLAVVFACGVERGKQLVRFERSILARQHPARPQDETANTRQSVPAERTAPPETATELQKTPQKTTPAAPKIKVPSKLVSDNTQAGGAAGGGEQASDPSQSQMNAARYAIQLVSYRRPQFAKQELDRLHAKGERAFLLIRNGRTAVYAGPFPSKHNAREKLARLKARYQDCFVRSL